MKCFGDIISFNGLYGLFHFLMFGLCETSSSKVKDTNPCDVSKCLSPQLLDKSKSHDKKTICRLLTPSLHCMETDQPVCRRVMGEHSQAFKVFVKKLDDLQTQYARKCHAIYTTCTEFAKCLHPQIQQASHHEDVNLLCKKAPGVISCFESAITTCEKQIGYRDANFNLIESKLDQLRAQTSARCEGPSWVFSGRSSLIFALVLAIAVRVL